MPTLTTEEAKSEIKACFGRTDFDYINEYCNIAIFLADGHKARMTRALQELNQRLLQALRQTEDYEESVNYFVRRMRFYRGLDPAQRGSSANNYLMSAEERRQWNELRQSKPLDVKGVLRRCLRAVEESGGFPLVAKEPVYLGFVPGQEFLNYLERGWHWKDLGVPEWHGEFTHRIQWCLMILAGVFRNPTDAALVYQSLGRAGFGVQTAEGTKSLWDVLCDRQEDEMQPAFMRSTAEDDFRKPEFLTRYIASQEDQLAPLATIISSLVAKRTYHWGPRTDWGLIEYIARKVSGSRNVSPAELQRASRYFMDLQRAGVQSHEANVSGVLTYDGQQRPQTPQGYPRPQPAPQQPQPRQPGRRQPAPRQPRQQADDAETTTCCEKCYLTTATTHYLGRSDRGEELETLRWFRDHVMAQTAKGRHEIQQYYRMAPIIVHWLRREPSAPAIYSSIYHEVIVPSVRAIQRGQYRQAHRQYRQMVQTLASRFGVADRG